MKKLLAILLVLALSVTMFAACGDTAKPTDDNSVVAPTESSTVDESVATDGEPVADVTAGGVRTGLAVVGSFTSSKPAEDGKDGLAQTDAVVAAVLLDENNVIIDAALDTAQTKINFSGEGVLTTTADTVFQSKHERGEDYGMRDASEISKEWFEQANALTSYVIGKTVDEVNSIALTDGAPADADLAAGVTVDVSDYLAAFAKAAANATVLGASTTDKIGLGIVTSMNQSKDATAEEAGLAQAYSSYAVVTINAEGIITSAIIDASQGKVNFDATGQITSDVNATLQTKKELGEGYGMRGASEIGKEWNEQADALAAYLIGKSVAEAAAIVVEDGVPTEADLAAGVTISIGDLTTAVAKASANALLETASVVAVVEPVEEPTEESKVAA